MRLNFNFQSLFSSKVFVIWLKTWWLKIFWLERKQNNVYSHNNLCVTVTSPWRCGLRAAADHSQSLHLMHLFLLRSGFLQDYFTPDGIWACTCSSTLAGRPSVVFQRCTPEPGATGRWKPQHHRVYLGCESSNKNSSMPPIICQNQD